MDAIISEIMTKLSNIENRSLSSEEYESLYAKLNEPGWDQNPEYAELKQYFLELYPEQRSIGGQRKTTFASRPAYCSGAGVNCHSGHFQGAIVTFGRDQEKYLNCRCFRWAEASFKYKAVPEYKNYNFKSNLYVAGACEYKASPSSTPQYWSLYGGLYETPYTSLPDGGKWYSAKREYKFKESKGKIHLWRGHISPDRNFYNDYRIKVKWPSLPSSDYFIKAKWPFRPSSDYYLEKKIKYPFKCSNDQLESPYYNGPLSCSPGFVVCQPYIKILRLSPPVTQGRSIYG